MSDIWAEVERLIVDRLGLNDDTLEQTLAANAEAELPAIEVSPAQGKMLEVMVRGTGARRVLEIGTLGGYSTTFLARGLPPGGSVVTLEAVPRHAETARANLDRAGFGDRVDIRVGKAADTLAALVEEGGEPFDFVFIDADKAGNASYLDFAARLGRAGTMIVVDNVVRGGDIADPDARDAGTAGTLAAFDLLGADSRFDATAIQTVGSKGYDGFALAVVTGAY